MNYVIHGCFTFLISYCFQYDYHIAMTSNSSWFWSRIGTHKMHHRLQQNCAALWLYSRELSFFTRRRIWVVAAHRGNHPCWLNQQTHNKRRRHCTIYLGVLPFFSYSKVNTPIAIFPYLNSKLHYTYPSETLKCPNPCPTAKTHLQEQVERNSCLWLLGLCSDDTEWESIRLIIAVMGSKCKCLWLVHIKNGLGQKKKTSRPVIGWSGVPQHRHLQIWHINNGPHYGQFWIETHSCHVQSGQIFCHCPWFLLVFNLIILVLFLSCSEITEDVCRVRARNYLVGRSRHSHILTLFHDECWLPLFF